MTIARRVQQYFINERIREKREIMLPSFENWLEKNATYEELVDYKKNNNIPYKEHMFDSTNHLLNQIIYLLEQD